MKEPEERYMKENETDLKKHHSFQDFLYWNTVVAVPIFTAFVAIFEISVGWFIVYLLICIGTALMVYKFYCSHCPYYVHGGKHIKCMFFWGVPKFFPPRPGSLSFLEKSVSIAAPVILVLFPLYWLIQAPQLLIIFVLSLAVLLATARRYECRRCVFFECPSNCVPDELKEQSEQENAGKNF